MKYYVRFEAEDRGTCVMASSVIEAATQAASKLNEFDRICGIPDGMLTSDDVTDVIRLDNIKQKRVTPYLGLTTVDKLILFDQGYSANDILKMHAEDVDKLLTNDSRSIY